MPNQHEHGPWKIKRTECQIAIYATRCECFRCRGGPLPWPLATYSRGRVYVPAPGVPVEALRELLREVEKP